MDSHSRNILLSMRNFQGTDEQFLAEMSRIEGTSIPALGIERNFVSPELNLAGSSSRHMTRFTQRNVEPVIQNWSRIQVDGRNRLNNLLADNQTSSIPAPAGNTSFQGHTASPNVPFGSLRSSEESNYAQPSVNQDSTRHGGSTSMIQEMRNNFPHIYDRQRGRNQTSLYRRKPAGTGKEVKREQYHVELFAFGLKSSDKAPGSAVRDHLNKLTLGSNYIDTYVDVSAVEMEKLIREAYPRLGSVSFELLRAFRGGIGITLERICPNQAVPSAYVVKQRVKRSTVYIRPLVDIIDEDDDDEYYYEPTNSTYSSSLSNTLSTRVVQAASSSTTSVPGSDARFTDGRSHQNLAQPPRLTTALSQKRNCSTKVFHPTVSDLDISDDILTIDELRKVAYEQYPVNEEITMERDNFVMNLLTTYHEYFNYFAKPIITFVGLAELGIDHGALRLEYFFEGMESVLQRPYQGMRYLFEGKEDHKIPTIDVALLLNGVYGQLGKFIAHSIIHTGVGLPGLSEAVATYLATDKSIEECCSLVVLDDIPDNRIKEIIKQMEQDWADIDYNTELEIQMLADEIDYKGRVGSDNAREVSNLFKSYYGLLKRAPQLASIKQSMVLIGIQSFLSTRPFLLTSCFPRQSSMHVPIKLFLSKIFVTPENSKAFEAISEFLETHNDHMASMKLLRGWSASPMLQDKTLTLTVRDAEKFVIHACADDMVIPKSMSNDDIKKHLDIIVKHGYVGFGAV